MLRLAVLFLLVALLAGMLQAGGLVSAFADIAWGFIAVFLVLAMLSLAMSIRWRSGPPV